MFMSEEAFIHINCLNIIQVQFRLLQSSFLCFSLLLLSRVSTLIYTISLPSSLLYTWTIDGLC